MFFLFLSTLGALVTWKELCEHKPGSTLSTSINGSRSCYRTTKRFAFLYAGTVLAKTIDISNNILKWFRARFKNVNPWSSDKKRNLSDLQKIIAHLAHRPTLRTLKIAFAKRLKSSFVQAKFIQTLCIWPIHVPNKINSAIVIPTIRVESTTHCNCSRLIHTCLPRKIAPCREGEFRDG